MKPISIFLSVLLLFQSCATNYTNSFSQALYIASNKHKAIEISTTKREKLKFQSVVVSDDSFYGIKKNSLPTDFVPINIASIKAVKLKDRTALNVLEWVGIYVLTLTLVVAWIASGFDWNFDD